VGGVLPFQNTLNPPNRLLVNSRISMLLLNGVLYFGYGHNPDTEPYHGWVFSYKYDFSAKQFVFLNAFCTTPNDSEGGVWQGGQGLSTDGQYIYANSGNGNFDPSRNAYGMSVMKLSLDLKLVDYFTPTKWKDYSNADEDVSGCGSMLIPNSPYLFTGITKYGGAHLIDTRNMGKWNAVNDSCRQSFILSPHIIFPGGNPVGWSDGQVVRMYTWAPNLPLYQFTYDIATQMIRQPLPSNSRLGTAFGQCQVSSNGPNDAILWAFSGGNLYAFDASKDISGLPIWRDSPGTGVGWVWPMVVNGRVYLPTGDGSIVIYGLK